MIGIIDSGLGGVHTLQYIREVLPQQKYLFLADTAYLPYGTKSSDRLQQRVFSLLHRLFDEGCDLVIIACNTAAAHSIRHRQALYPDQKVLSVTIPGVEKLVAGKHNHVALWATQSTIDAGVYTELAHRYGRSGVIDTYPLNELVTAIESGNTQLQKQVVSSTLASLDPQTDAIILGCTHFPLVADVIANHTDLPLIDSGWESAQQLVDYIDRHPEYSDPQEQGLVRYVVTGDVDTFSQKISTLYDIHDPVQQVVITDSAVK